MMGHGALTCGEGDGVGGTLPRSNIHRVWIVASSSCGASWMPSIAAVRRAIASRILSVAVMLGTGMARWQNWNVSVMRSPPELAIKTQMQWYWLGKWERYQALEAWYPQVLRRLGFMCTRTSVPRGAMGVASKEKVPSRALWAKRRGF